MVSALFVMILFSLSVDYEIEEGSHDGSSGDTKEKDLAPSASPTSATVTKMNAAIKLPIIRIT